MSNSRPPSPPLFSPSHRPILATSASFTRPSLPSPSPSSAPSSHPHEDPWRQDLPESPSKPQRSFSEGDGGDVALPSWAGNGEGSTGSVRRKRNVGGLSLVAEPGSIQELEKKRDGRDEGKGKASEVDGEVTESLVEKIAVVASMVETSNGRDKILKLFQYSARSYVYLNTLANLIQTLPPSQTKHLARLKITISSLSLTRKCLILFAHLDPLKSLLSPSPLAGPQFFMYALAVMNGLADDVYCLSKLGVVSKRRGAWADKWSNRFWLLKSLIELIKLHTIILPSLRLHKSISALDTTPYSTATAARKELEDAKWTVRKLLCDVVFASYDVFRLEVAKEPVLCATGLMAGLISTSKLYDKHLAKVRKS